MAIASIQPGSTTPAPVVSPGQGGGSRAEQAYRAAVKQLNAAQKKLAQDATNHATNETIQLDSAAVTMAAAAVATAAAALAREQQQSQQPQAGSAVAPAASAAAAKQGIAAAATRLDTYA